MVFNGEKTLDPALVAEDHQHRLEALHAQDTADEVRAEVERQSQGASALAVMLYTALCPGCKGLTRATILSGWTAIVMRWSAGERGAAIDWIVSANRELPAHLAALPFLWVYRPPVVVLDSARLDAILEEKRLAPLSLLLQSDAQSTNQLDNREGL
jgi:hypothetical protein